jgi:hypothetical protein
MANTPDTNPACAQHCKRDDLINGIRYSKIFLAVQLPAGDGFFMGPPPIPYLNAEDLRGIDEINKGRESCTGPVQVATGRERRFRGPEIIWQCGDMPLPAGASIVTPGSEVPGFLQTVSEVVREHPDGFIPAAINLVFGRGESPRKE